jgi:hypothetical protein
MVNSKAKSASRRTVEDGPTESLKLDRNEVMPETSAVKSTLSSFFFARLGFVTVTDHLYQLYQSILYADILHIM